MKKFLLLVATVSFMLGGCAKYEEGPGFSLRSKKARLTGEWQLVKYIENGQDEPLDADDKDDVWKIEKDGKYELQDPGNSTETGTWTFNDSKESITFTSGGFSLVGKVLRLTNKELWMEFDFFGDKVEQHLEKK